MAEFCGAHPTDSELAEKVNAMEGRIFPFTDGHGSLVSPTCPYGVPGDRLWVRETLCKHNHFGLPCGPIPHHNVGSDEMVWSYAADGVEAEAVTSKVPSIFMPRWASRLTLELTGVRVERVQDISVEDIIAEGCSTTLREHDAVCELKRQYRELWDSINAKRGYPWASNPWRRRRRNWGR